MIQVLIVGYIAVAHGIEAIRPEGQWVAYLREVDKVSDD